jgi:uncharacterized protein (TIGR03437 family)
MAMSFQRVCLAVAVLGVQGAALAQTQTDLFDDSALHEVRITMPAANWASLKAHYLENTYYNVDSFQWKGIGSNTLTVNNLTVRSRGHGSRSPVKPGLHVDFNRNVSTQNFLGLNELDLKNNSQDPSLIHERLSMELFTRMGVPASREVCTKVFVNGEYIGLYNLVESPDTQMMKRVFGENNGYLYEYKPGDWLTPNIVGSGYHFEFLGDDYDKYSSGTVATPFDPQDPHQNSPDTVTLHDFIQTMNQAPDSTFLSDISKFVDPKAFLTINAVENYLADFDCILGDIFGLNNFFLYRFTNKQFNAFIAWDKDNAFDWTQRPILQNADKNVLMRRLIAIPELKTYYFDQIARVTLMAGGSGGWLQHEADRLYSQTHQAALDDPNKSYLESGLLLPTTNDHYESAVVLTKRFAGDRTAFVVKDLANNGYQAGGNYPQIVDGSLVSVVAPQATAAGGLGALYGANLGDAKSASVYVNGYPAPIVFGSAGQIDLQIPWEGVGFAPYGVVVNGLPSPIQFTNVQVFSPDILAVAHSDGATPVTPGNPASAGETVVIYATGLGTVNGSMVTGQPASTTSLQATVTSATVKMNSTPAAVVFSGLTPGFLGLYQVNATIPSGVSGTAFVDLSIGGQTAPSVNFPVK